MDSDSDNDVVFREKTIEDIIEEQRAKLALDGKQGTPVTAESFATWRKAKLEKKQADAEERRPPLYIHHTYTHIARQSPKNTLTHTKTIFWG